MKVEITNLQKRFRINRVRFINLTKWLMNKAAAMDTTRTWIDCSVVMVGHDRMIELNRQAMNHEGTTDVITFAYPTQPGEPAGWRGEIILNVEEASDASTRLGSRIERELALYLAHGCQHLGGADDRTKSERAAMNRRQNKWLRDAEKERLLNDLIN